VWLLIFFLTPIIEMYLLIEVAGYIDTWPTIFLVMLTAVIGVALLKRQGLATLTRGMGRLQRGEVPAREMAEGILLAVAGALLVTPGFVTDTVGFVLLFPPSRVVIAERMLKRVEIGGMAGGASFSVNAGTSQAHTSKTHTVETQADRPVRRPVTLEGDYEERDS
jgi:UPF0716 protein FxsA